MTFQLLLDIEVCDFIASLPRREQIEVRKRLEAIRSYPAQCADYQVSEIGGRMLDVHASGKFAYLYWFDLTDKQIKILSIEQADG